MEKMNLGSKAQIVMLGLHDGYLGESGITWVTRKQEALLLPSPRSLLGFVLDFPVPSSAQQVGWKLAL